MRSYSESKRELLLCRLLFGLAFKAKDAALIAVERAKVALRAADTQYAELRVKIEILEDEMDLPEAQRTFKGRHDSEIESVIDLCPAPLDSEESKPYVWSREAV